MIDNHPEISCAKNIQHWVLVNSNVSLRIHMLHIYLYPPKCTKLDLSSGANFEPAIKETNSIYRGRLSLFLSQTYTYTLFASFRAH